MLTELLCWPESPPSCCCPLARPLQAQRSSPASKWKCGGAAQAEFANKSNAAGTPALNLSALAILFDASKASYAERVQCSFAALLATLLLAHFLCPLDPSFFSSVCFLA